ncbi:MAG: peptidylprolyl isomerase, partial [Gammaproteobacteria bacterium]|nr:peptidylprolyl isomerase [Gammaproteobacteria bacterium]
MIRSMLSAIALATLLAAACVASAAENLTALSASTMEQILKASKPSDWRPLNPNETLYMDLP